MKIKYVKGRQVFDSRGNPTVEAEVFLDNGISASAISPSGASTGAFEAHELRDKDKNKFLGKSVNIAVKNINDKISSRLKGLDTNDQKNIDRLLSILCFLLNLVPYTYIASTFTGYGIDFMLSFFVWDYRKVYDMKCAITNTPITCNNLEIQL